MSDWSLTQRRLNVVRVVSLLLLATWLIQGLESSIRPDTVGASVALVATTIACGVLLSSSSEYREWSTPFLVFIPLALFHVGAFLGPALSLDASHVDSQVELGTDISRTCVYIALGLSAYTFGVVIVRPSTSLQIQIGDGDSHARVVVARVGAICLILSVSVWILFSVRDAGPTFFMHPYLTYLNLTASSPVGLAYMGIALGAPMLAQRLGGIFGVLGAVAFFTFAVLAFPLGLRGEVLTPLVAAVAIYVRYGSRKPRWWLYLGVLLVLLLISLGRVVRTLGLGATDSELSAVGVFDAMEEMGSTARVVGLMTRWHDDGGESFLLGLSYVAPVLRYFNSLVGVPNIPGEIDYRLFNSEILDRAGPIGGSVFAESYHNFGIIGLVFVPALCGIAIAWTSSRSRNAVGLAWSGLVTVLFLAHVRDASTHLLLWAVCGAILIIGCVVASGVWRRFAERYERSTLGS